MTEGAGASFLFVVNGKDFPFRRANYASSCLKMPEVSGSGKIACSPGQAI